MAGGVGEGVSAGVDCSGTTQSSYACRVHANACCIAHAQGPTYLGWHSGRRPGQRQRPPNCAVPWQWSLLCCLGCALKDAPGGEPAGQGTPQMGPAAAGAAISLVRARSPHLEARRVPGRAAWGRDVGCPAQRRRAVALWPAAAGVAPLPVLGGSGRARSPAPAGGRALARRAHAVQAGEQAAAAWRPLLAHHLWPAPPARHQQHPVKRSAGAEWPRPAGAAAEQGVPASLRRWRPAAGALRVPLPSEPQASSSSAVAVAGGGQGRAPVQ